MNITAEERIDLITLLFRLQDKLNNEIKKIKNWNRYLSIGTIARKVVVDSSILGKKFDSPTSVFKLTGIKRHRNDLFHGNPIKKEKYIEISNDIAFFGVTKTKALSNKYRTASVIIYLFTTIDNLLWEKWLKVYEIQKDKIISPHYLLDGEKKDFLKFCSYEIRCAEKKAKKSILEQKTFKDFDTYLESVIKSDSFFQLGGFLCSLKKEFINELMFEVIDARFDIITQSTKKQTKKAKKMSSSRFLQNYFQILFIRNSLAHPKKSIEATMKFLLKSNKESLNVPSDYSKIWKMDQKMNIFCTRARTLTNLLQCYNAKASPELKLNQEILCYFLFFFSEEETKKILDM